MARIKDTTPDENGRSSGKLPCRLGKLRRPPKDEPWSWLTREILISPAWRMQGINCRRFVDFLLLEDQNHAGTENGNLLATYDQLMEYGLTRSEIKAAILEAGFLGLVKVTHAGGRYAGNNFPSTYLLTFYPDRDGAPPTQQWKGKTAEAIKEWKQDQAAQKKREIERRKKQNSSATSRTTVVRFPVLPNAKTIKTS